MTLQTSPSGLTTCSILALVNWSTVVTVLLNFQHCWSLFLPAVSLHLYMWRKKEPVTGKVVRWAGSVGDHLNAVVFHVLRVEKKEPVTGKVVRWAESVGDHLNTAVFPVPHMEKKEPVTGKVVRWVGSVGDHLNAVVFHVLHVEKKEPVTGKVVTWAGSVGAYLNIAVLQDIVVTTAVSAPALPGGAGDLRDLPEDWQQTLMCVYR